MCLTAEALALFLGMLGAVEVTRAPETVTIHATSADVEWILQEGLWCTDGPAAEAARRAQTEG